MDNKNVRVGAVIVAVLLFVWWKSDFSSMPQMTRAGTNQLEVGKDQSNRAYYALGSEADLSGAVVDYSSCGSLGGGGFLSDIGGRRILSFMGSETYAAAVAWHQKTGQCFGSCLGAYQSKGQIGHLILIPRDDAALGQMKHVGLPDGGHFRMSGQYLNFESAQHNGSPVNVNFGGTGFFLVSSISSAD